jgi:hypothetical protein
MQCARCQHENRPGAKFCEECAHPAGQAAPSTAPLMDAGYLSFTRSFHASSGSCFCVALNGADAWRMVCDLP